MIELSTRPYGKIGEQKIKIFYLEMKMTLMDSNEQIFFKLASLENKYRGIIVEAFIAKLFKAKKPNTTNCDLVAEDGSRIEVKCSLAKRKTKFKSDVNSLLSLLDSGNLSSFVDSTDNNFYCQFQNIKLNYFDKMYYVILHKDVVKLYCINKQDIVADSNITLVKKAEDLYKFDISKNSLNKHDKYYVGSYSYLEFIKTIKN